MEQKKRVAIWLVICAAIGVICLAGSRSFGNPTEEPYYTGSGSIGAWYDETWEANKCQMVMPGGAYSVNMDLPKSIGSISQGHASMPQDVVITEWKVTGHVHFESGSGTP